MPAHPLRGCRTDRLPYPWTRGQPRISLPLEISNVVGDYSLAVTGIEVSTGAKLTIQSGTIPPALLDHFSISLDIDAYFDSDIPMRLDEIWKKAEILRHAKNAGFENCITDELRILFQ